MLVGPDPDTLYADGVAALQRGDAETAVRHLARAVALAPEHATAHEALGFGLQRTGQPGALAALRRAVQLNPKLAGAHNLIGFEIMSRGDAAEALPAFEAALAARPTYAAAQVNAGLAHQRLGAIEPARLAFARAAALKPDMAEAHNALGTTLQQLGRPDEAAAAYRRAIALKGDYAEAINNLGRALRALGEVEAAIAEYGRAIALRSDYADARWNRALLYLLSGRFAEGWAEQEWRWRVASFPSPRRSFAAPLWNGEALDGATILLHAEQGLGDTLQFLRYVPLVAAAGGRVVLEVQAPLARLAGSLAGVARLVRRGDALPDFAWHAPLLSLPRAFATTPETIPARVPYLHAAAADVAPWRSRLPAGALKVGLVWAGNPTHSDDANRSLDCAALAPLLALPGVRFYSLQLPAPAALPDGVVDLAPALRDFVDSAAALAALDLLITADTSAAHLAGALGAPVWTLLPFAPDWRWLLGRDDSPWYPSMRLFRQRTRGDWAEVLARVAATLAEKVAAP